MPTKKEEARTSVSPRSDEIIEAFKDPTVVEAIASALGPFIARAIDAALEKRIGALQSAVAKLSQESAALDAKVLEVKAENERLATWVKEQGERLEELEIYSRAHDLIIKGLPESSYSERATSSAHLNGCHDVRITLLS